MDAGILLLIKGELTNGKVIMFEYDDGLTHNDLQLVAK
jgi:hypothetical protein